MVTHGNGKGKYLFLKFTTVLPNREFFSTLILLYSSLEVSIMGLRPKSVKPFTGCYSQICLPTTLQQFPVSILIRLIGMTVFCQIDLRILDLESP